MDNTPLSLTLFDVAVALYVAGLLGFMIYLPLRRRRIADTALALVALGWPFHLASIVTEPSRPATGRLATSTNTPRAFCSWWPPFSW